MKSEEAADLDGDKSPWEQEEKEKEGNESMKYDRAFGVKNKLLVGMHNI